MKMSKTKKASLIAQYIALICLAIMATYPYVKNLDTDWFAFVVGIIAGFAFYPFTIGKIEEAEEKEKRSEL